MQNYSPIYNFNGAVRAVNAPVANTDLVRKQDASGLSYISSIAAGSQAYLSVSASGALTVDSLLISDVTVDGTQTSLANFIANESASAAALKKGDILVLTNATGGAETYIVSGANGSVIGSYTKIESALTAAEIVALLSGGTGINIASNGTISFNGDTDVVSEGSSNLYYTEARFTSSLNTKSTTNLAEGTNQYFTQSRARASVSASAASGLQYSAGAFNVYVKNSSGLVVDTNGVYINFDNTTIGLDSNGKLAFKGDTSDVSEGSNLYHTTARARASVSAAADLSYNSGTGVFSVVTYKSSDFNTDFAAKSTTDLSEGTNLYHTTARARAAISGSAGIAYNSGTGAISLDRYSATVNLVANTAFTVNHALSEKFVHVSVYDASGNKIHADVVLTDANNLSVTSVSNLSGAQVICSL